jgi:thymidylate synthase (FAD)
MNIVTPYARLMDVPDEAAGIALLKKIEWCGRISHRSEDAQSEDSWTRFLNAVVIGHGDWSIVEHASASVDFYVDRGVTHELVRHRLFAFTQESTRFVNYEKKIPPSFIKPEMPAAVPEAYWEGVIQELEKHYRQLLAWGCAPQIARSVFPNALASRIIVTGNLRNWRHFFLSRTTKETHPQMREVTIPLLDEFKGKIPILYDDIEPLARQADSLRKAR